VIVIVSNGVEVEDAEEMVRRLLESWQAGSSRVGGVAVLGCKVRHKRRVHSLDALAWTPCTCTVVEVKGFRSVQHGMLDPRDNGAWRVGGAATCTRQPGRTGRTLHVRGQEKLDTRRPAGLG
jgi:hypothetical protein